jgi:hypothetical protein
MNNELCEQSIAQQRIIEDLIYEHARVARDIVQIDAVVGHPRIHRS